MKKRFLLFMMFCALPFLQVSAQEYGPFMSSPFAGVTAGKLNPASLAGTKYKFDVMVFGGSAGVHNDFFTFGRRDIIFNTDFYKDLWDNRSDLTSLTLTPEARKLLKDYTTHTTADWDKTDGYSGSLSARMDILNMMYSFSDRFSMGIGYSQRYIGGGKNGPLLAASVALGDNVANPIRPIGDRKITDKTTGSATFFKEINLSGAYTILEKENYRLKLGATVKVLFDGTSAYGYAENYEMKYRNGIEGIAPISGSGNFGKGGVSHDSKMGFGADFGVEYEYRPAELAGNEIADYRLKVGASILDLGGYKSKVDGKTNKNVNFEGRLAGKPNGLTDMLNSYGTGNLGDYTMALPTVITGQIDYNFGNGLFLNFTPYIALNQSSANKAYSFSSYNLVPHFELKNFGVSVPLQYDQFGKFTAGIGVRAWKHVWLGSNTIIKNVVSKNNYSADLHVMVKIPIMKDASKDRDGDGVPDKIDQCPDVPGLKKFMGCPDTDGDGIPDHEDKCPNEAGPASTGGCPDRDGDGIIDKEDRCPDVAGPAELQGCPDRDGDGVADIDDACPDEAGPKATKGCPDRDGDGVADKDDRCPDQAGPVALQGCPDRDGDGVPDIDDKCPDVPGTKANNGCPEAVVADNVIVEFGIDKFNIQPKYNVALDAVVKAMVDNPNANVNIVGHSDNTYLRSYNMNLSKKRAEAVKTYLVKKKADAKRISTQYYGPDKPVADNTTKEGRAKNRRSEITIVIK